MKTKLLFLVLILTLFISNLQAQQWESLGPNDFDQPTAHSADDDYIFKQDSKGTLYVAYDVGSHSNENRIIVSKRSGSTWETVGGPGSIVGKHEYLASMGFNFDKFDNPYISYADFDNQDKVTVKKWNGSSWEIIGDAGFSAGSVLETSIVIDDSGNPYVLYQDEVNSYYMTVKKWDGSAWVIIGTEAFTKGGLDSSIGLDSKGNPYVVYSNYSSGFDALEKWNGSNWEIIVKESDDYVIWMGMDSNDKIYSAIIETNNDWKATVKTWNGNSWDIVGAAGFTEEEVTDITIGFNSSGVPYVAYAIEYYKDGDWYQKVMSKKWNGTSWETLGNTEFFTDGYHRLCMSIDKSETPYISYSYSIYINDFKVNIRKFNGSTWALIGETGISERYCYNSPSLALDSSGNPFIFYLEIEPDNVKKMKVIIKKFNGSTWETIGDTKSFSISTRGSLGLDIDSSGNPFIAFSDFDNNNKITVKRWNGNTWETISEEGLSNDPISGSTFLSINSSGMPYIAYAEKENNDYKVNVKKFNGNAWETVGDTGVSIGNDDHETFYFAIDDASGTPFIACADANYKRITVKKFNGSAWEIIGDEYISDSWTYNIFLTIDSSGTPYVSYGQTLSHSNMTYISTVKKFNGSEWETIGVESTFGGDNALVFDAVGDLYFAYADNENYGTATVKKYDGNNWEAVGNERFTAGVVIDLDFAIDNEGNLTVVYQDHHYIFAKNYATGVAAVPHYADTSSNVLIYPNPTSDSFKVSFDKDYNTIEVEIYDILGKKVLTVKNNIENIDISTLQNGIYIIKLKTDNGNLSKKLIVNKYKL